MTSYLAVATGVDLAIRAVTYELRITLVNLTCFGGGSNIVKTARHDVSSLSGGSVVDVVPLYEGAPAASATARSGSLTFSGTQEFMSSCFVPPGTTTSTIGFTNIAIYGGSNAQIQPELTLTVSPGSVFHVSGATAGTIVQVYFEEIRLVGSY